MKEIPRSELIELVSKWEAGVLDERQVHEAAETIWSEYRGPRELPREDSRSIAVEVASQLEILNHQLITTHDIAAILSFLETPSGEETDAWEEWLRYWDSLDYEERQTQLASNPYYSANRT